MVAMSAHGHEQLRVLGVFAGPTMESVMDPQGRIPDFFSEMAASSGGGIKAHLLHQPALHDVLKAVSSRPAPDVVYLSGGVTGSSSDLAGCSLDVLGFLYSSQGSLVPGGLEDLCEALAAARPRAVYLDATGCQEASQHLQRLGLPCVLSWASGRAPPAAGALFLAQSFFAHLAVPGVQPHEAAALASAAGASLLGGAGGGAAAAGPRAPKPQSGGQHPPLLCRSAPAPSLPCLAPPRDSATAVALSRTRLATPLAELCLLVAGGEDLFEPAVLDSFCRSLRSLLVAQLRGATVVQVMEFDEDPGHPDSLTAGLLGAPDMAGDEEAAPPVPAQCTLLLASGCQISATLCAPWAVMASPQVLRSAAVSALAADAASLQVKLPPPGAPAPFSRPCPPLARGAPLAEIALATSAWAVQALQALARSPRASPALAALGVAAVSHVPVSAMAAPSGAALRLRAALCAAGAGGRAEVGAWLAAEGTGAGPRGSPPAETLTPELGPPAGPGRAAKKAPGLDVDAARRPPLAACSDADLQADIEAQLQSRLGWQAASQLVFTAQVQGGRVDLARLYRAVALRGGFGLAGRGLHWASFAAETLVPVGAHGAVDLLGVSSAALAGLLQSLYAAALAEYEAAHPSDLRAGSCALCGRVEGESDSSGSEGEEPPSDWVSCDACERWVHLSCDRRPTVASFQEYAESSKTYVCPGCEEG